MHVPPMNNLKLKYKDKLINDIYFSRIEAYNVVDFEFNMWQLESRDIYEELDSIGISKWSCSYSPRRRCCHESLNATIIDAKELPISSMLEVLRKMLQSGSTNERTMQISK